MIEIMRPLRLSRRLILGGFVAGMVAGLAVLMQARAQEGDAPAKAGSIEITARPITHFERGRPEVKRFGELEFRGGLVLTSPSSHFGGWSDLIMEADGNSLFAISDVGGWFSADIKYEGTRPIGLANARLGPILAVTGRPLADKREQDAESLTLVEGNLTRRLGADRLRAPASDRPLRDPRPGVAGAVGLHEATGGRPPHERQPGPGRSGGAACGSAQGIGGGLCRAADARQRLSHGVDLDQRRAEELPAARYRGLRSHRRGGPAGWWVAGAGAALPLDGRRQDAHPPSGGRRDQNPARASKAAR